MYAKNIMLLINKLDIFLFFHNKKIKNYNDMLDVMRTFASQYQCSVDVSGLPKNGFGW